MMQRIWLIAVRDFTATISSKGFLIGLLLMPLLGFIILALGPRFASSRGNVVFGQVEIVDPTNAVAPQLRSALEPGAIAARRLREAAAVPAREPGTAMIPADAPTPEISVIERQPGADIARDKQWLLEPAQGMPHLALVVVHSDAVARAPGRDEYGTYDLYVAPRVRDAAETAIREGMKEALISARLKSVGIDRAAVDPAMQVDAPKSITLTPQGERPTRGGFARMLPFVCGILLFLGIITGGQILMTSTVEEKSSRVVEVLLAAISPVELMAGKLIGQLGVGLLIMAVYLSLGVLALSEYALAGLIDPMLVVYLVVFYFLAYLTYGGLMIAIGAAVNQIAEAQSFMGPVMLLLIAPYALVPLIGQAPNSPLSVAMSFIPPINTFAILARLASDSPPPLWQVLGSMLAGAAGALLAVWFAAKVFRIGLLMHGKPPNFATLVRWARAA